MKAQTVAAIPLVWASSINNWSMPFFNVPMTVVAMAALGSMLSFAWGEREQKKRTLYVTALASAFTSIVIVAIFPDMLGWEWVKDELKPPLAGGVALGIRFAVPHIITLIPEVLRKIFRLDSTGGDNRRNEDAVESSEK